MEQQAHKVLKAQQETQDLKVHKDLQAVSYTHLRAHET